MWPITSSGYLWIPSSATGRHASKGTRVPVHLILEMLASGDTFEGILESYPFLTKDDLRAALSYAAELAREEISELKSA